MLEPLERSVGDLLDVLRSAVQASLRTATRIDIEAELAGDHDPVADRRKSFTDQLLVRERPVDLGGVEEGDAVVDGRADERDSLLFVDSRTVTKAQSHAAEADRRNLEAAAAQVYASASIELLKLR